MSERFKIVGKEYVGHVQGDAYIMRDTGAVPTIPFKQWSVWENKADVEKLCDLMNSINERDFYHTIDFNTKEDMEKFQYVIELVHLLIDDAVAENDSDLAYESLYQLVKRLSNFNNKKYWIGE